MNIRQVSIKGVLVGGIVDVVGTVVLGMPFALFAAANDFLAHVPADKARHAIQPAAHAGIGPYIGLLLVAILCSVLGGYIAARLASHDELLNGALSAFLCVSQGIYSIASGKDPHPMVVQILLLVSSPALGLLGGWLRLKQTRAQLQQPQPQPQTQQ
ncbi:MAG: hypothetical protein ABR956_09650 [Terracidiphilus sp.]